MEPLRFQNPAWEHETPGFWRRTRRALLRDLGAVLLLALCLEAFLRLFVPSTRRYLFSENLTGGHPVKTNSLKLRDDEIPVQRPPFETRILVLGNSTTWGTGVAMESTYSQQLERRLGSTYNVINAGGEAAALDRALLFVEEKSEALEPSVVVVGFSPSMIAATANSAPRRERATGTREPGLLSLVHRNALMLHRAAYRSYAYTFLDTNIRRRLYRIGVLRDRLDKRSGATYAYAFDDPAIDFKAVDDVYRNLGEQLGRLQKQLQSRNIALLVLTLPSRFDLSDLSEDNERGFELDKIRIHPAERLGRELTERGIRWLDASPRLRKERAAMIAGDKPWRELFVEFDYSHLDADGHAIVADELQTYLRNAALLKDLAVRGPSDAAVAPR